jgi:hypothetical protein
MESTGTHCLNGFESFIPKITYRYRRWRVLTLLFTSSQDIIGMEECGRRFSPTTEIYSSDDLEQETTQEVASTRQSRPPPAPPPTLKGVPFVMTRK